MLTTHGQHHPRAGNNNLFVPRKKKDGRGLMQIERAYTAQTIKMDQYVECKEDPLMQIVRTHQRNTNSTLFPTATNFKKPLQIDTKQIKNTTAQNMKERWEAKRLHGQFPHSLDEELIDKKHYC
jgi:hypothetical protein